MQAIKPSSITKNLYYLFFYYLKKKNTQKQQKQKQKYTNDFFFSYGTTVIGQILAAFCKICSTTVPLQTFLILENALNTIFVSAASC